MLDLSTAVLCDFAQVRDRLLFISSGAVSRLYRRELPAPLGLMVGLVIEVPLDESGIEHTLRADIVNRHGDVLATLQNTFRVGDDGLFPHEVQQVPLVLSITGVRAKTWGTHQVRLSLDDELVRALTLYVVPAAGVPARPAASAERAQPTEPEAPVADPAPIEEDQVDLGSAGAEESASDDLALDDLGLDDAGLGELDDSDDLDTILDGESPGSSGAGKAQDPGSDGDLDAVAGDAPSDGDAVAGDDVDAPVDGETEDAPSDDDAPTEEAPAAEGADADDVSDDAKGKWRRRW